MPELWPGQDHISASRPGAANSFSLPPFHPRAFGPGGTPSNFFTMIGRSTRWLEAVPLRDILATSCVDSFVAMWVSRFGVPEHITSNCRPQFTSAVWSILYTRLGISHRATKCFVIDVGGKQEVVTLDRLKPHLSQAVASPAMPLARWRLPKRPSSSSPAVPP